MKNISTTHRQILRTISAASAAVLFTFFAGGAHASSSQYVINGTTVTGSGNEPNTAYFLDSSNPGPTYTITITSGSNLGNTTGQGNGNEIEFTNGSVNNLGSLLSDSAAGILINGIGSVTNNGTINAGEVGIAMGNGYVINAGSISGVHGAGVDSFVQNNGTTGNANTFSLTNNNTISSTSGETVLVQANNENNTGTAANSNTVTISNSAAGTLTGIADDAILINGLGNSSNTSTGANSNTLSITNAGAINAGLNGIELQNIANLGNTSYGVNSVSIANSGIFTTTGDGIKINGMQNDNSGGSTPDANTVAINNTGAINTGDEAIDIRSLVNNGNHGNGANTLTIANTASLNSSNTIGDEVVQILGLGNGGNSGSGTNTLAITNSGAITGMDSLGIVVSEIANASNGATGTNAVNLINSGAITTNHEALDVDNISNASNGGNAVNTVTATNSGSLTVSVDSGISIATIQNTGNSGTATNTIGIQNTGAVQGFSGGLGVFQVTNANNSLGGTNTVTVNNFNQVNATSEGIGLVLIQNTGNGGNGVNTVSLLNTATVSASTNEAIEIDGIENDTNSGVGTNTVSLTSFGSIVNTSSDGVQFDDIENNGNTGSGVNTNAVSLTTSGSIIAAGTGLQVLEVENKNNTGSGVNTVTLANSAQIIATGDRGIGIHDIENNHNAGSGPNTNTVNLTNSGTLEALHGDGVDIKTLSNFDNTGTGASTNNVTLVNSQIVFAGLNGINISTIRNQGNHGDGINTVTVTNTAEVDAFDGSALHIDTRNSGNAGAGTNTVSVANSGFLANGGAFSAIDVQNENSGNTGTGLNSNNLSLTNTGTASVGGNHVVINLLNNNVNSAGNASNNISIYNSGDIVAPNASGMSAINESTTTAGNNTQSITFINSGSLLGLNGDAVDLGNSDTATTGTSIDTIKVINGSTGSLVGSSAGLNIENAAGVNNTVSVTNAGEIEGTTYGILMSANNASIVTEGGLMFGGTDVINLQGANSNVTVLGRTQIVGVIEGNSGVGNTLTFDLAGMTSAQITAAQTAIANAHGGAGSFAVGTYVYQFDGFLTGNIVFNGFSFQEVVDPGLRNLGAALDSNNANLPGSFDLVYSEGFLNPEATLNQLSGREFLDAFSQIGLSNATAFSGLADSRAFDLRSGATGLDFSRLNMNPSTMIASLGNTQNVLNHLSTSLLGGTEMSDSKQMIAPATESTSRWGAWVAGNVTFADQSGSNNVPGYNATSGSPTIGIDYRLCPDLVLGGLFNYTTGGVNFGDGSNLNTSGELGGIYADWAHQSWYINGLVAGGHTSYDQSRVTLGGATANASPSGNEVLSTLAGGYDFKTCGFIISPELGWQYTHLSKDSFSESGAGAFDLNVGQQDVNSLRSKLGFTAAHPFTCSGVKINPELNTAWYHEFLDTNNGVSNSLPGAPALGSFVVNPNTQGRDFAVVGAGITATPASWHSNVSFFVNYNAQVGQSNFLAQTVGGGVRFGF